MANILLTNSMIANEGLMVLYNNCVTGRLINREYDDKFGVDGAKIGNVFNARRPPRYLTALGQALQIEDATETSVPIVLNTQRHLGLAFTSQDRALSIDMFSERFIKPGIATLSNLIDFDVLGQFTNAFNEIGTPGTVPNLTLTYLQVGQRLSDMSVPFEDRRAIISTAMNAIISDTMKGLFNPQRLISDIIEKGAIAKDTLGFDFYMDQNTRTFTVGSYAGGTPVVNGANQTGSSIITSGWPNSTAILNQGDIISFANVFSVNAQNRQPNQSLAQWVVTAPVVSYGGGAATIPISGPLGNGLIIAGPFQNASASPANNAAITVQGASGTGPTPRGLAFHRDAITLAMADLELPGGVHLAERAKSKDMNASLRLVQAYDINMDRFPFRADVLYGVATLYPELMCRIAS
jgi:hypothetical protein